MTPRPPLIAGTRPGAPRDAARIVWWYAIGFARGTARGSLGSRALSAIFLFVWPVAAPLLALRVATELAKEDRRFYFSSERDAVIVVVALAKGWSITGHASSRPGSGTGRALRAAVAPQLIAAATRDGIPLLANAATRGLTKRYQAELPGLVDVGRAPIRGRRLRWSPP